MQVTQFEKGEKLMPSKDIEHILTVLQKRDDILKNNGSMKSYNHQYDILKRYCKTIINAGQQSELAFLLDSENISYKSDMAGILYNSYPEKCALILNEISKMSVENGLPFYYINLTVSAYMTLEIGIPKDFP